MPAALPHSPLGERFERAVAFAIAAYRRDRRLASDVKHIAHVFGVCAIVLENGGTESEAIAAILQRSFDRRTGREFLGRVTSEFGADVAAIVRECNDVSSAGAESRSFYDRTVSFVDRLRRHAVSDEPLFLVSAADALYAARTMNDRLLRGEDVFATAEGKKYGSLWAFRALADAYDARDGRHASFVGGLAELVDAMAGKPVTAPELLAAFAIDDSVERAVKGSLLEHAS